jgi:hypothetical protein
MTRLGWMEIEKQFCGKKYRLKINGKQITCKVVDCTLGRDVIVNSRSRSWWQHIINQTDWLEYMKTAKETK